MFFYVKIIGMSDRENLHAGHRERMIDKVLNNPDGLYDYELLEVLLFFALPRKNTNPIAHKLLKVFGDLDTLIHATPAQLQKVEGVGKRVAAELTVFFSIIHRLRNRNKEQPVLNNSERVYKTVERDLKDKDGETFLMLMLDGKFTLLAKILFSDNNISKVKAQVPEIVDAIDIHKPAFAIIVHNHPGGDSSPSEFDDLATIKVNFLCELHGVNLIDHMIISKNGNYSYRNSNRLQEVKDKARMNDVLSTIIKEK